MSSSRQSRNKSTAKADGAQLDAEQLQAMLERAQALLSAADYALLQRLVTAVESMTSEIDQKGMTIARLRRLFGLSSSEKSSEVLGANDTTQLSASGDEVPAGGTPTDTRAAAHCSGWHADRQGHQCCAPEFDDEVPGRCVGTDEAPNVDGSDAPLPSVCSGPQENNDNGYSARCKPKRKGHGRVPVSAYVGAEQIEVQHTELCVGQLCPACSRGRLYKLGTVASILQIVGNAPLQARCHNCEQLRCSGCGKVFTAKAPEQALGPKYTHSAVSMMALLRYGTGFPLNRLAQLQQNLQVPVPASTQWEVTRDALPAVRPAYVALVALAAQSDIIHNDDTSARILQFMGKRRAALVAAGTLPNEERTGIFTTGIVSIADAGPIALFYTGRNHAGENLKALLDLRPSGLSPPIHMSDGLDRNVPKNHQVSWINCLSHGRRQFVPLVDNFRKECRHILEQLAMVYYHDAICRQRGYSAEQRLDFHLRHSATVMADLRAWMQQQLDDKLIEPNGSLGKACEYMLKRWDKLTAFLRLSGAPLDNNICERVLKMAIRHRNNSLFYYSERGAEVGDTYMTLIFTAQLHGINPFDYLTALLAHEHAVAECPDAWLPWTYRATLEALEPDKQTKNAA